MKLEIGKTYKTGTGHIETVAGLTRHFKEWVWTIQGNWYRQSDGRQIIYRKLEGGYVDDSGREKEMWIHEPRNHPSLQDLTEEISNDKTTL